MGIDRLLLIALTSAALLAGCGGNTSWYFCSGSDAFCARNLHLDGGTGNTDDGSPDEPPDVRSSALDVARKTPQLVENGLETDALQGALDTSPDAIGGWLLTGSLGLLVDDADNASASRFFDQNRYWLASARPLDGRSELLEAGLLLLAAVAEERDPEVAATAARLARGSSVEPDEAVADVSLLARDFLVGAAAATCCSVRVLAAAAVVLCDDLETDAAAPAQEAAAATACAAARGWFSTLSAP